MSEQNYSIERDLKEAEAMTQALDPYLYEDTLYGRVSGGGLFSGQMPALTLGALLMRLRRLTALHDQMTPPQQAKFDGIKAQHDKLMKEWRTHYENKLTREVSARLSDMQSFFNECREDPRLCASAYKPEALRRTLIQEIMFKLGEVSTDDGGLANKVKRADSDLRRYVKPGDFIWDNSLRPVYPQDIFWWLYGTPG